MSDADVIESSLVDSAAFAPLFDRHFRPICRFLAGRVGMELAEDLAAETFLVAFRRRSSYDTSRGDARPWLYGIAVNLLREHKRAETRRLRACARTPVDGWSLPSEAGERLDTDVSAALLTLSTEDRSLILLYAWAELSYEQLGEALDLPLGTVRSRLSRIRTKLSDRLLPVDDTVGVATGNEVS